MTTNYPDDLVSELEASLLGRNDIINRWANAISSILMLPGLRGCWPMSSIVGGPTIPPGGNANDLSGNGLTLTYNGNPTYNIFNNFVPYIDLDGTGDFLSIADTGANDPLDILGTETYIASALRGLTLGGWFWQNNLTGSQGFLGKFTAAGNQRSYNFFSNAGTPSLALTSDGTGGTLEVYAGTAVSAGQWFFSAARYIPSTTGDVWVNREKTTSVSALASIFNSTSSFAIGDRGDGSNLLTGRASLCWLCAAALPDATIIGLFEQQRVLFGI